MRPIEFQVIDSTINATVTMNNPYTGYSETIITSPNAPDIAYAIVCFAARQDLFPHEVETSIIYPEE